MTFVAPHGVLAFVMQTTVAVESTRGCAGSHRVRREFVQNRAVATEVRDVAPGLWLWRTEHPDWSPDADWEPLVTSTCVRSGGEVVLLDPLAPPRSDAPVWERLDGESPTVAVILKPDHVRDVDLFVQRYGARPFGPSLFWPHDVPETDLEPIEPGTELPGGLIALYDGRGRNETPLWLPEQRTIVFADALTAPGGELRVWATPWHEERALPALRALLELPFERIIVAHGEPVHGRAEFERALKRRPWGV
jgi:glyoxylase-like metal-dependent hydrolase (beta-lactamase superfamily II)